MNKKRLIVAIIVGAVLGVFCIIGASVRFQFERDVFYLSSLWYNRVIMGLVIGLTPKPNSKMMTVARGALLGTIVSFAFYLGTGLVDHTSFVAGILYGIIIALVIDLPPESAKK